MGGGGGGTTRPAHLPFLTMRVRLDVRLYSLSATLCLCDSLTVVCLCAEHDPRMSAVFCILDEMYVSLVYPYDISFSLSTVVRLTSHFFSKTNATVTHLAVLSMVGPQRPSRPRARLGSCSPGRLATRRRRTQIRWTTSPKSLQSTCGSMCGDLTHTHCSHRYAQDELYLSGGHDLAWNSI